MQRAINRAPVFAHCARKQFGLSLALCAVLLCSVLFSSAQWQKLEGRFANYDVLNGLSDRGCNVAVEGKDSFIWIGSWNNSLSD